MPSRPSSDRRGASNTRLVAGLVLAGSLLPLVLYAVLIGRTGTITPREAKKRLWQENAATLLVDVRPQAAFAAGHIDGAVNEPLATLLDVKRSEDLRAEFHGKTLLLVCNVGTDSRQAAQHLAGLGITEAVSVRGGIQEWIRDRPRSSGKPFEQWQAGNTPPGEYPGRQSPGIEQFLVVLSFVGFKTIYTFLALLVVIALWMSRDADLVALRWAMICFFLGENACAINYVVFRETSYLMEYLHSLGMSLCFGFTAYAILEGLDRRVLHLTDPQRHCAAIGLCGACSKSSATPCRIRRLFFVLIPACAVLALMLPTADWRDNSYTTQILGQCYHYAHLRIYQQLENVYCAAAALAMFAVSLVVLATGRQGGVAPAKVTFAAGLGPLGFGFLRMLLGAAYDQNRVWYLFWEETTELVFILAVVCILGVFYRTLLSEWAELAARWPKGPSRNSLYN